MKQKLLLGVIYCSLVVFLLFYYLNLKENNNVGNRQVDLSAVMPVIHELPVPANIQAFNVSYFTTERCKPPHISDDFIFNEDVLPLFSRSKSINCGKHFNDKSVFSGIAFHIKNGNHLHKVVEWDLSCCYLPFFRDGEDQIRSEDSSNCIPISQIVTIIPKNIEYIDVLCKRSGESDYTYRDAFPLVHLKTQGSSKSSSEKSKDQLNIIIIGLDSTSRLNFQRQMTLSNSYLLNSMGAISLDGYSVISQGTRVNVIPMLTGLSLVQFQKIYENSGSLDDHPFIWKELSRKGYLTNFAEDSPIFHFYWDTFENPPTDYYLRPLVVRFLGPLPVPGNEPLWFPCMGPRLGFETILNFAESVREISDEANKPHFQFTWTSTLAHEDMNSLGNGDLPLFHFLANFKRSTASNRTVLFVLGDHGAGIPNKYYDTPSGITEYKSPLAYIVLPTWFQDKYPEKYNNLLGNSKKMTTSYDIFKTLHDLIDLHYDDDNNHKGSGRNKNESAGISLFRPISERRKCLEAGISLRWCLRCYSAVSLNTDDHLVKIAANFIVNFINNRSKDHRSLCAMQTLDTVEASFKWDRRDVYMELCNIQGVFDVGRDNLDFSTIKLNASCSGNDIADIVNVKLKTSRCYFWYCSGATYQGEVMMIWKKGSDYFAQPEKMFLTDAVIRTDQYASKGWCVLEIVKPYCICN